MTRRPPSTPIALPAVLVAVAACGQAPQERWISLAEKVEPATASGDGPSSLSIDGRVFDVVQRDEASWLEIRLSRDDWSPTAEPGEWSTPTPLRSVDPASLPESWWEALRATVEDLHGRGVVLGDLHHRDVLIGTDGSDQAIKEAAAHAVDGVTVLEDLYGSEEYKTHLAKVYVARAMKAALADAG